MKDYSYHSLFYYRILSALRGFVGGDGRLLSSQESPREAPAFSIVWHPRTGMEFRHNFERNRFLENRARYIIGAVGGDYPVIVLKEAGNSVTIYREAIKALFGDDWGNALQELVTLMEKFYTVDIEEMSELPNVDLESEGRHGNHTRVNDLRPMDTARDTIMYEVETPW